MNKSDDLYMYHRENTELRVKVKELEQQLKECRTHLTESVSKECKCKVNTSVNNDLVNRNLELKKQLKEAETREKHLRLNMEATFKQLEEAEKCIEFYTNHTHVDYNTKTAREYLKKYKGEK